MKRAWHWPRGHAVLFLAASPPRPAIARIDPAPREAPSRSGPADVAAILTPTATEEVAANPPTTTALASTPGQLLAHRAD
jgi:hypothetical protein